MRVGPYRRLSTNKLMLSNCGVGEDLDAGKDRGQEEKGTTEDAMIG